MMINNAIFVPIYKKPGYSNNTYLVKLVHEELPSNLTGIVDVLLFRTRYYSTRPEITSKRTLQGKEKEMVGNLSKKNMRYTTFFIVKYHGKLVDGVI